MVSPRGNKTIQRPAVPEQILELIKNEKLAAIAFERAYSSRGESIIREVYEALVRNALSRDRKRLFNILIELDLAREPIAYIWWNGGRGGAEGGETNERTRGMKRGQARKKEGWNGERMSRRNEANNPIEFGPRVRARIGLHIKQAELSPPRWANEARFLH